MLRNLREQKWYLLLWLPLLTALALGSIWLWIMCVTLGGWTLRYATAQTCGLLSAGVGVLFLLTLILLFPRKPAGGLMVALASTGLIAVLVWVLFYSGTRVVSYEVLDVDGVPLEGIPVYVTHHANGIALTWFSQSTLLHTDAEGKASIRIFKSEQCGANVNDPHGDIPGWDLGYANENMFYFPQTAQRKGEGSPFTQQGILERSYLLEFQAGLPSVWQRFLETRIDTDSAPIRIYLRRQDSATLPPYYSHILRQDSSDPDFVRARLMSLGGSIESFNHLNALLPALAENDWRQDAALDSLDLLASQINAISRDLPSLSLVKPTARSPYSTKEEKERCSRLLYGWLSGSLSPPDLPHAERLEYIQKRMEEASLQIIDALHPLLLKKKSAYSVLRDLERNARPALKFYPEVFERGTDEAKLAALLLIESVAPPAKDVAFLLHSKTPGWSEYVSRLCSNSSVAKLAADLETLEALKSKESDPQTRAAFEQVIQKVQEQLARNQAREAGERASALEPRYAVIDLGTKMISPFKITNSGYILGRTPSSYGVWSDGELLTLEPLQAGDELTVEDIDEAGEVVGREKGARGSKPPTDQWAVWQPGVSRPTLLGAPGSIHESSLTARDPLKSLSLPQPNRTPIIPQSANAAVAPLPAQAGTPRQPIHLVSATQVIGNSRDGGYLWEMIPTLEAAKTFEGPYPINDLLPGEPKFSPWNVTSVASINDGGTIVGTATYQPTGPQDPIAAGPHGVMLLPLAIVRERTIGSGDFGPITHNGLDDQATLPIYGSGPAPTAKTFPDSLVQLFTSKPTLSTPATDGQGIFYIEMPGSAPRKITLKSGSHHVTVQAIPVPGRPQLLRTGKLVLIEYGDPFRAPDITTLEVGGPGNERNQTLQLQMYDRTVVK